MDNKNVKKSQKVIPLPWKYDFWGNIERIYPLGSPVEATFTIVKTNSSWLKTPEGVNCYLNKSGVKSAKTGRTAPISSLTEKFSENMSIELIVSDYNYEKKQLLLTITI